MNEDYLADVQRTLSLFGMPVFSLVLGLVFLASLAGLIFGVCRWNKVVGKIAFIASALLLLLFALAIVFVLVTVKIGSMG
jgi:hypothetical protein